ncbi:hypothetical protein IFO70_01585 [Phormidium tenue FACHB-886]|nr:hypothetical protein [Phormidium tenue FACHB-886]
MGADSRPPRTMLENNTGRLGLYARSGTPASPLYEGQSIRQRATEDEPYYLSATGQGNPLCTIKAFYSVEVRQLRLLPLTVNYLKAVAALVLAVIGQFFRLTRSYLQDVLTFFVLTIRELFNSGVESESENSSQNDSPKELKSNASEAEPLKPSDDSTNSLD